MTQTGWERSIGRSAQEQTSFSISVSGKIAGGGSAGSAGKSQEGRGAGAFGRTGGSLGISSQESSMINETVSAHFNIIDHDVRQALANAERLSARSSNPSAEFANGSATEILGPDGLRNRCLGDADSGRGVVDVTAPVTSLEQSSLLNRGRFSTDMNAGIFDGDPHFKKSAD